MTVDFVTYCCNKDRGLLQENLGEQLKSHNWEFDQVHIIHQRCEEIDVPFRKYKIDEQDYDHILSHYNINPDNEEAERYTHGWTHAHYWKHHCVNHLLALDICDADYLVMSDADCKMLTMDLSWIGEAISILERHRSVLVVSPSDGSPEHRTQTMSQQLFICEPKRLKQINFDLPFEGFKDGGPFAEFYFMIEGRISKYMEHNNLYRYMLGEKHRYIHLQW